MRTETCNFNFLLRRSYETSQNIKILFCSTTSVRFILYQGFSTKFSGWPVVLWLTSGSLVDQWFSDWPVFLWLTSGSLVDQWFSGWPVVLWLTSGSLVDQCFSGWLVVLWLNSGSLVDQWFSGWPVVLPSDSDSTLRLLVLCGLVWMAAS